MRDAAGFNFWRFVVENISSLTTILVAIIALILSRLGILSAPVLPSVTIALLALLTLSLLVDHRRLVSRLSGHIDNLSDQLRGYSGARVRQFNSVESALDYLAERTSLARVSVEQASLDKQRARRGEHRIRYEQAREGLILANRVKYRYIGIVDDQRRFVAVKEIIKKGGSLENFYAAFQFRPPSGLPLFSFTIFDREEVVTRAPYDTGEDPIYISIRSVEVANLFHGYFEKLWLSCRKIDRVEEIDSMLEVVRNDEGGT